MQLRTRTVGGMLVLLLSGNFGRDRVQQICQCPTYQEARRAWFHAMSNVFKGPGPTGPGQQSYKWIAFDAWLSDPSVPSGR